MAHEADDIPQSLIDLGPWCQQFDVELTALDVDEGMVRDHDRHPFHVRRRDGCVERMQSGESLPPLIALGHGRRLVDGYARLRALRLLGIVSASVCVQWLSAPPR